MTRKATYKESEDCVKESTAQLTKANEQLQLEIIKRKQAEEALRETHDYLESLVNHANAPIIAWNPDLKITRFNSALEHLTGYAADEIIGKGFEILFPETRCEYFLGKVLASSSERWDSVEIPIRCKNGKNRTVLWNSANIYAKDGAILIASIGQGIDITDYKLAEKKTNFAYAELKQIFDIIHSGVRLVDKNFNVIKLNQAVSNLCGISMDEAKGKKCYETFSCNLCDTPQCILNRILSGEEHIELEVEKKCFNGATIPCILSAAPFRGYDGDLIGMVENVRDITKFKNVENELQGTLKDLRRALRGTIRAMALTVGTRDPYTAGHQLRVTDLARAIAKEMGFSRNKIAGIRMAGIVHDIGKIAIPSEILAKPGQLSKAEAELIKSHPQTGYDILKPIKFPGPVAQIVLQHHERMDGSGYPDGLLGKEILIEARILGVADVVEAMASHRPYRPALGIDKALEEISNNRGKLYDVEVVDACLKVFKDKKFKFKI